MDKYTSMLKDFIRKNYGLQWKSLLRLISAL